MTSRLSLVYLTACVAVIAIGLLAIEADGVSLQTLARAQTKAKAKYTLSFHRYTADQAYMEAMGKTTKPITNYMDILSRINSKDTKKQAMVLRGAIPVQRINLLLGISYPDMPVEAFRPISETDEIGEIRSALERVVLVNKDESMLDSVGHIVKSLGDLGTMKDSHFGDKQHWHAMDSGGKTNGEVRNTILDRVKSLYQDFRKADRNARFWYIGQILHCIQDSFSDAHAARDVDDPLLPLLFFQDYKAQNGKLHGVADINIAEGECEAQFELKGNANLQHLWKTSDIHRVKRVLWNRALEISTELFKMLDKNGRTHSGPSEDLWEGTLKKFFEEKVFKFKSREWENAKPGGSLPLYAKNPTVARRRDEIVMGQAPSQTSKAGQSDLHIDELIVGDIPSLDIVGQSDPFAVIDVNGHSVTTSVKDEYNGGGAEVTWKIDRRFKVAPDDVIHVKVYDSDAMGSQPDLKKAELIGESKFSLKDFSIGGTRSRKNLLSPSGGPKKGYTILTVKH